MTPGPTGSMEGETVIQQRVLAGRYEILDFLGQGGMAGVYRARDRVLQRPVAIKILSDALSTDPGSVERFRREARAAASLNHPGIVAIFDTGVDGDLRYIVMEHVEGETLDQFLRRQGRLDPDHALSIAEQVCASLGVAHASGVIHRDVKPGNIMLAADGAVKVMDFGIARALGVDTGPQTAAILGTASYLSPEQARGDPVDARSDLYSLGAVLYEMLAGKPPFAGDNPIVVAAKHLHEQPAPVSQVVPSLGPAFDAVVLKALSKQPDDRFGSVAEFGAALHSLRAGGMPAALPEAEPTRIMEVDRTSQLPPIAPEKPPPTTVRRRAVPVTAALGALLVLSLVVSLVLLGLGGGADPGGGAGGAPRTSSPTTTSPATTTPPQGPLSVGEAATALASEVAAGVQAGDISRPAANEILREAGKAIREFQDEEVEEAQDRLAELDTRIDKLAADGEITSQSRVDALHADVAALDAAMGSSQQEE